MNSRLSSDSYEAEKVLDNYLPSSGITDLVYAIAGLEPMVYAC